ncbi:rhomboid-domain-containing protein [Cylindrobasidium torrendii FP15055 ss-10]|uniref:Rhomboid-type serine protease n=1 Tax=Cylindrobasidium torrendii FP15055 ss-10 TaxID=1314674 RepID=A0A0D7AXG0_9AGAR|nr:rhomboid-domain-containing protein [Cylindrobasidium torrendii FP15055 ss-10]
MADTTHQVKFADADDIYHDEPTPTQPTTKFGIQRANSNLTTATGQTGTTATSLSAYSVPEDDAFDHRSLSQNTGLVRGASTRSKSPYPDDKRASGYGDDDYYGGNAGYSYHQPQDPSDPEVSLMKNAAQPGTSGNYQDLEYGDPYNPTNGAGYAAKDAPAEKVTPLSRFMGTGKYPIAQRIEDKKRGIGRQRYPFLVWILSIIMVGVFIDELVRNSKEQGSPVSFKPVVNYMLGPSSALLINEGARFPACMKTVTDVPSTLQMGCMNNTANPATSLCTIEDLCGHGGFDGKEANQWWRFITPIFIHAGFVHIALNLFAQLTLSAQIEREMGTGGFFFTFMAAGIFGNVFGGNFSLVGIPSVGASGAIFGTLAVTWVDLLAHWKYQYKPVRKLIFMIIELIIGFAVGYIPYLDNFAHIGGFLMGLMVGMFFYPVISETKRHKMITWGFRIVGLTLAIVLFVVLTKNFYTSDPYEACDWCRYLSCWPTSANDHCHGTGIITTSS